MPGLRDWFNQRFRKRQSDGVAVRQLSDDEIVQREERWQAEATQAREEAFRDSTPVLMSQVRNLDVDGNLVAAGFGPTLELIVAATMADPGSSFSGADVSPGWASFPHSAAPSTYGVDVTVYADGAQRVIRVADLPIAHPTFQTLPTGGLLIVGARSSWKDGGATHNAVVTDATGQIVSTFCLGDGVEHVQVDSLGRIWVAYFDEGVFGNYGWGGPGPEPLGSSGLVCWSLSGEKLWAYSAPEGLDPIADCYALNVTSDEAWACYYTGFPIVRVRPDWGIGVWTGGASGAHAMAVAGSSGALVGGHRGLHDRLVLCDLGAGSVVQSTTTRQLQLPGGQDLPSDTLLFARGRIVAAIVNDTWYQTDIAHLSS